MRESQPRRDKNYVCEEWSFSFTAHKQSCKCSVNMRSLQALHECNAGRRLQCLPATPTPTVPKLDLPNALIAGVGGGCGGLDNFSRRPPHLADPANSHWRRFHEAESLRGTGLNSPPALKYQLYQVIAYYHKDVVTSSVFFSGLT
jgi:hypothetical protein